MNFDLLFVPDHQATADDGFFAAAGKVLAIRRGSRDRARAY
jgi:hypothetical protein